ncbi:MAG: hypothetical protein WC581_05880 [Thermodesulfovibrionales bacterium]
MKRFSQWVKCPEGEKTIGEVLAVIIVEIIVIPIIVDFLYGFFGGK